MPHTPAAPGAVPDAENDGPVPSANQPGHHPQVEQDKPLGRRPRPRPVVEAVSAPDTTTKGVATFPFEFRGPAGIAARAFTLTDDRAYVAVGPGRLVARYGPWTVTTPLENIAGASVSGPYKLWRIIGPARLSGVDRGLTFATNADRGVCIEFVEPVEGVEPTGHLRHPGLTVTVADPAGLVAAIEAARSSLQTSPKTARSGS